jgi:Putative auto-transporter adhesin, head GIN domain
MKSSASKWLGVPLLTVGALLTLSVHAQVNIRTPGSSVRIGAGGVEINSGASAETQSTPKASSQPANNKSAESPKAAAKAGGRNTCAKGSQVITLGGVGDQVLGRVACDKVVLRLTGVGDLTVKDLNAKELMIETSGTGTLTVAQGTTQSLKVTHKGTVDVVAQGVSTDTASVSLEGTGNIELGAVKISLEASLAGVGDISYKGSPQLAQSVTGTGDIKPVN